MNNNLAFLIYLFEDWQPAVRAFSQAATAYVQSALSGPGGTPESWPGFTAPATTATPQAPGTLTRVLTFVEDKIKTADGYTQAIGEDLRVIGAAVGPVNPDATPEAGAEVRGGEVLIKFKKSRHAGVWIEGQVGAETDWTYLAIDTSSPYNDSRPLKVPGQPEKRRYRLCFWDGDPTRVWCDVIEVTFGG
jgi:hypothetical protein